MNEDLLQPPEGWAEVARERLPAPPLAQRGLAFRGLSRVSKLFGREQLPRIFPVFNINGRLFWAWLLFASRLMPYGKLPARTRELLILRTAWNCRSRYEWGQHLELGLKAGLNDKDVLNLALFPERLSAVDACLVAACDQLCRDKLIDDALWQQLSLQFSEADLVEIMVLVGHYQMVAGLLVNAGIQLEPAIEAELAAFHQRVEAHL